MKIQSIYYSKKFREQFEKLPLIIKKRAIKQQEIFRQNPIYPSLRLHKLSGKLEEHWSISVNNAYRIIFLVLPDGDILFISVGLHAIYDA